jgi:hypothetical protein
MAALLSACVADEDEATHGGEKPGKYDAIDSQNDPARFDPNLERRFDQLPMDGQAEQVPWASDYWASARDSINVRWHGEDKSPAEKYAEAFNRPSVPEDVSRFVGTMSSTETIPGWVGICEGWSAAAIRELPAQRSVTRNGVTFLPGDLEGLVSLLYARNNAPSKFLSRRCNDDNARFDDSGRAVSSACRDTNPGTLHIIVTNYLGIRHESLVEDRTYDAEVWNQPIKGYRVTTLKEISLNEAVTLLGGEAATGGETRTVISDRTLQNGERESGMIEMPPGGVIHFNMTGTGDADLYVREGAAPTENQFTCRPYEDGSAESCTVRAAPGTAMHWMISGYASSSQVTLETTIPAGEATYTFNPSAKRFAEVELTLEYITESSPGVTRTTPGTSSYRSDGYHYVLELDATGTIIGGEYLRESQQLHPDFLWLPAGDPTSSVAGIRYSDVKALLNEAR